MTSIHGADSADLDKRTIRIIVTKTPPVATTDVQSTGTMWWVGIKRIKT